MPRALHSEVRLDTGLESLLERLARDPGPKVLATLVATSGSTYRKPGARMLIMADGSYVGLLSGGCLESDMASHAQAVLQSGAARAVEYDMRGPDDVLFGIGAGCEGAMRILLEPAGPGSLAAAALTAAGAQTAAGHPSLLIALHQSPDLTLGTYDGTALPAPELVQGAEAARQERESRPVLWGVATGRQRALVQFLAPPPHLLVCGAGPDAESVVRAAVALGWRVSVVDHRPAYAAPARFPGATVHLAPARELRTVVATHQCHAAVIMSHHLASDVLYLRALAAAPAPAYVGLLGPLARRQRIARELGEAAASLHGRIRGPVGIDIGAQTPEGIALSIISQIHAWLAGRRGADESVHGAAAPAMGTAR